ncbi:Phosphoglucan, water dikinase [Olea europaea subsp. europaea]|uniref:Phosphoglucan, water dikinase n=1 Tax=Olea europaea subsp. europaea TaxID=158383 RepID=A0A8S0PW67_OLEEU|nr:Phosphoglucan, water dikinase [Olea europaea subsp. europaea]
MGTITDSCWKVLVCRCNYRDKKKWVFCPGNFDQKRVFVGLSFSTSLQRKKFQPLIAASALSESESKILVASEETQINDTGEPKTVNVRFKLQKECAFGQHFLIVGEDPVFGLWDPSDAIPLNWSDGHVWSVQLDLPIGKVIKYKLILKGVSEEILWQPGPDRVLQTWETEKTITVSEDWYNPELQMIMEQEELVTHMSEEPMIDSELMLVAENLTQPVQEDETDVNKESTSTNGNFRLMENPLPDKAAEMVADNITEEKREPDLNTRDEVSGPVSMTCAEKEERVLGNDGSAINGSDSLSSRDEGSLFPDEGVPVLVPDLVTMSTVEIREESLKEMEKKNAANVLVESDKAKLSDSQEEEYASASLHPTGTSETMINKKKELHVNECAEKTIIIQSKEEYASSSYHPSGNSETMIDKKEEPDVYERVEKLQQSQEEDNPSKEELQDSVLESDLQWGRRTLQKFLANLGFQ